MENQNKQQSNGNPEASQPEAFPELAGYGAPDSNSPLVKKEMARDLAEQKNRDTVKNTVHLFGWGKGPNGQPIYVRSRVLLVAATTAIFGLVGVIAALGIKGNKPVTTATASQKQDVVAATQATTDPKKVVVAKPIAAVKKSKPVTTFHDPYRPLSAKRSSPVPSIPLLSTSNQTPAPAQPNISTAPSPTPTPTYNPAPTDSTPSYTPAPKRASTYSNDIPAALPAQSSRQSTDGYKTPQTPTEVLPVQHNNFVATASEDAAAAKSHTNNTSFATPEPQIQNTHASLSTSANQSASTEVHLPLSFKPNLAEENSKQLNINQASTSNSSFSASNPASTSLAFHIASQPAAAKQNTTEEKTPASPSTTTETVANGPYNDYSMIQAELITEIFGAEGGTLPVVAKGADGSIWGGYATLNELRVEINFVEVVLGNQKYNVQARAHSLVDRSLGLSGENSVQTVDLLNKMFLSVLGSASTYVNDLRGRSSTSIASGGVLTSKDQGPNFGLTVLGDTSKLFKVEDSTRAFVRVVRVPLATKFVIVVAGAPSPSKQ